MALKELACLRRTKARAAGNIDFVSESNTYKAGSDNFRLFLSNLFCGLPNNTYLCISINDKFIKINNKYLIIKSKLI